MRAKDINGLIQFSVCRDIDCYIGRRGIMMIWWDFNTLPNFPTPNLHHNCHRPYRFLSIRITTFYTLVYLYKNLLSFIMEIASRTAVWKGQFWCVLTSQWWIMAQYCITSNLVGGFDIHCVNYLVRVAHPGEVLWRFSMFSVTWILHYTA